MAGCRAPTRHRARRAIQTVPALRPSTRSRTAGASLRLLPLVGIDRFAARLVSDRQLLAAPLHLEREKRLLVRLEAVLRERVGDRVSFAQTSLLRFGTRFQTLHRARVAQQRGGIEAEIEAPQ